MTPSGFPACFTSQFADGSEHGKLIRNPQKCQEKADKKSQNGEKADGL
jgi:hypothetical protein